VEEYEYRVGQRAKEDGETVGSHFYFSFVKLILASQFVLQRLLEMLQVLNISIMEPWCEKNN
jgi:hypothetical protein